MAHDQFGSYSALDDSAQDDDLTSAEKPDALEAPVPAVSQAVSRAGLSIAISVLILVAAMGIVWFALRATSPVSTPALVSLSPSAAEAALRKAGLTSGKATYEVARGFPAGIIIGQSPDPYSPLAPGSAVSIKVAVAPKPAPVPDVVGLDVTRAQSVLAYALFTPTVTYAYTPSAPSGQVIEQLPRASDTALTGSEDVIVVSLGVGTSRSVVPALIGKMFVDASAEASNAALFAKPRAVIATGTPDGRVVDQAPSSGTLVPAGTNVWVSVADSRATP